MFCPKCRAEYRPEINVCTDCAEALVPALPVVPGSASWNVDLVTLVESEDIVQIALAKMQLDNAGIRYEILGENAFGMWDNITGYGGCENGPIRIKVLRTVAEAAIAVIKKSGIIVP